MTDKPFWSADDQVARLAELTSGTGAASKDLPLRRDVRSLGKLLGRIIREQAGEELLEIVENPRQLLIQHREKVRSGVALTTSAEGLMVQAQAIVARMDLKVAYRVTKAFAIYFELTNLAETNHRKRRRRARNFDPSATPLPGSFQGMLQRMKEAGITSAEALQAMRDVRVEPVFTAHPTEVAWRSGLYRKCL